MAPKDDAAPRQPGWPAAGGQRGADRRDWRAEAPRHGWRLANRRRVLVLQAPGQRFSDPLLTTLLEHQLIPVVAPADRPAELPDPAGTRLAVLTGSERYGDVVGRDYVDRQVDWVRRADAEGTTVLGLGHGARVLAVAFGGSVATLAQPLTGWAMVATSVPHWIAAGPWLSCQHDMITLPSNAELLAHNRLGPQAFRLGRHLGVQFHPEATAETLAGWGGAIPARTARDPRAAEWCSRRLFSGFVAEA